MAPQLITDLSDGNREKRNLVHYSEIPPALVHAIISVEDKHFFSHRGFDPFRIMKAAYVDLKDGRKEQGASTLSMQLARALWLDPDKSWKRKAQELLITMHLEQRLTKQQIFEYYASEVYMGRRGPFSINGFGEAAHAYFDKDVSQLNVREAALLAGMVQRPSYYNPFRYPERARERRNVVLRLMRANRYLSDDEYRAVAQAPVAVRSGETELLNSQYFLDLVNDELQNRLGEREPQSDYVYTTLDMDLQRAAVDAVRIGMQSVDEKLRKRKRHDPIPPVNRRWRSSRSIRIPARSKLWSVAATTARVNGITSSPHVSPAPLLSHSCMPPRSTQPCKMPVSVDARKHGRGRAHHLRLQRSRISARQF